MEISVHDLLDLKFFSKAKLIAGKKGLSRIISSVNVFETPATLEFVSGGELFLTTGFSFFDDEKLQEKVIHELSQKGVACLAITLIYAKEVPAPIIKAADTYGLPLIVIDKDCSYQDIYKIIDSYQFARTTKEIKAEDEVVNEIYQSVYEHEFEGLLKVMHKWTGLTASLILNHRMMVYPPHNDLYQAFPKDRKAWKEKEVSKLYNMNIRQFTYKNEAFTGEWLAVNLGNEASHKDSLILFKDERDFSKGDYFIINCAASVCLMEFKRFKFVTDFTRENREKFLKDIFKGDCSVEDAQIKCYKGGLDFLERGIPVILSLKEKPGRKADSYFLGIIDKIIKEILGERSMHCFLENYDLYIFLPEGEEHLQILEDIQLKLTSTLEDFIIAIGVGRATPFSLLKEGFAEAYDALTIGLCLGFNPKIYYFNQLGFYRLLNLSKGEKEFLRFFEDFLKPVSMEQEDNDLLNTLINYVECNFNFKDTAAKMFLHINTIRYRISVIEKLCRIDLKKSYDRFNIETAIKILPLIRRQ